MLRLLFVVIIICIDCIASTIGSIASSIPSYNVYATCSRNLDIQNRSRFHYYRGSLFEDSFIGIPVDSYHGDIWVRTDQNLSLITSVYFGYDVRSISHNDQFLIAGGGVRVSVYVWTIHEQWSLHSTILSPSDSNTFGEQVSLSNTTLLIGDYYYGRDGGVHLYQFVSNTWSLSSTLTNSFNYGYLGLVVTIAGTNVAVTVGANVFIYAVQDGVLVYQSQVIGNFSSANHLSFSENLLFIEQTSDTYEGSYFTAYVVANRSGVWHQESEIQSPETYTYGFGLTFFVNGDLLLVASTNDVWEYTLGAYQVPPAVCRVGDSTGSVTDDSSASNDDNSGDNRLGLIVGVAAGGGSAMLCLCIAWYFYVARGKKIKVNTVYVGGVDKVDGYLVDDKVEGHGKPKPVVTQATMYV